VACSETHWIKTNCHLNTISATGKKKTVLDGNTEPVMQKVNSISSDFNFFVERSGHEHLRKVQRTIQNE